MSHGLVNLFGVNLLDGAGSVLVFFTISGFLITYAAIKKYPNTSEGLRKFYWNRAIRLYPSYWLWLIFTITLLFALPEGSIRYQSVSIDGSNEISGFWKDHAGAASWSTILLAVVSNITGLFADSLLNLSLNPDGGLSIRGGDTNLPWAMGFIFIGQFWSIGVELIFYAIAPFIVRSPLKAFVLLAVSASGWLGDSWRYIAEAMSMPAVFLTLRAPNNLWLFMLGSLLAHAYISVTERDGRLHPGPILLTVAGYGLVLARAGALFPTSDFVWWQFFSLTLATPCLFYLSTKALPRWPRKVDNFIGDLSYPVYINHFLIIQIAGTLLPPSGALFAGLSCSAAVAIVLFDRSMSRRFKQ
jgi:peptidoglycan/LPS O-acetylase OafA/YrhL